MLKLKNMENFSKGPKIKDKSKLENIQNTENKEREKEIKQFLLIRIKDLTNQDFSDVHLRNLQWAKVEYIFEVVLLQKDIKNWQGFGKKFFEQLDKFYKDKGFSFEELNGFILNFFEKFANLQIREIKELEDSYQFKALIEKLKSSDSLYKEGANNLVSNGHLMLSKLKEVAKELPFKKISFFYKPNEEFPKIEESLTFPKMTSLHYTIPSESFQEVIQKYFHQKLLEELKKPD